MIYSINIIISFFEIIDNVVIDASNIVLLSCLVNIVVENAI